MSTHPQGRRPPYYSGEGGWWDILQRLRMFVQIVIALALEIYYDLPHHHYPQGAAIGLGILILTTVEVVIRWWRDPERRYGAH